MNPLHIIANQHLGCIVENEKEHKDEFMMHAIAAAVSDKVCQNKEI